MNPFKHKEISLSSGYYFDVKNKLIVYLDKDTQSEYFGRQTLYSRESSIKPDLGMLLSGMYKMSNINDLEPLEVLEDIDLNKSLIKDFDWICQNTTTKEHFLEFLNNNELYNMLHLFNKYLNPVKEKKKVKPCIVDEFPKYIK